MLKGVLGDFVFNGVKWQSALHGTEKRVKVIDLSNVKAGHSMCHLPFGVKLTVTAAGKATAKPAYFSCTSGCLIYCKLR